MAKIQARIYKNGSFSLLTQEEAESFSQKYDISLLGEDIIIIPGLCDVHVHLREPGFFHKETIKTGSLASAHGGYTTVCTMPNLSPVPDCKKNLQVQLDIIKKDACIEVLPYGSITKGEMGTELVDFEEIRGLTVGFTDDGRGVQSEELTRKAMQEIAKVGGIFTAHLEDDEIRKDGMIHDCEFARKHNIPIIPSEAEYGMLERDIRLIKETGVKYHVCHLSTKEGVEMIRKAKAEGVDITCETAPHYLALTDADLQDFGRFKMNPPIRSKEDRDALIAGLLDGTVDMIATDHAPHTAEEKSHGLLKSAMGVVGIETAFATLYTNLVKTGIVTLEKLVDLMTDKPRARFGIAQDKESNFAVFDLGREYEINEEYYLSMGTSSPFNGSKVFGATIATISNGGIAWKENQQEN